MEKRLLKMPQMIYGIVGLGVLIVVGLFWIMPGGDEKIDFSDIASSESLTVDLVDREGNSSGTATVLFEKPVGSKLSYGVFQGNLYALKNNSKIAQLLGPYSKYLRIANLKNGQSLTIVVTKWGFENTFFLINGKQHSMGKNGRFSVVGNEIILMDDISGFAKKINVNGELLGKMNKSLLPK